MIRPTLILQMDLDESVYSDEVVTEIKRSYSYVAPSVVKSHETGNATPENRMRFMVKMHRAYWRSGDEGADEVWDEVMRKWLKNMVYKVSNTMVAYNRQRRQRFEQQLVFDWLEVEFSDVLLSMRLNADCSLEEHGAVEIAEHLRALVNDGTLEGDIVRVCVPSHESYETQLAAVEAARAEEAAAQAAEDVEDADAAADEPAVETEGVEAEDAEEAQPEPEPVNFDIDTTIWGIEYADGAYSQYNTKTNEFVA